MDELWGVYQVDLQFVGDMYDALLKCAALKTMNGKSYIVERIETIKALQEEEIIDVD